MAAAAVKLAADDKSRRSLDLEFHGEVATGGGGYSWIDVVPRAWSHLVGETVAVWADGIDVGTRVISGGGGFTAALDTAAAYVVAGLPYTALFKSAKLAYGAQGGTAIGQWLALARQIFAGYPAQLRHAILLTDGKNQHETPERLAAELSQCEGTFSCDCRGVGTDWEVKELRTVSTALLGTVDIVPDPAGLAARGEIKLDDGQVREAVAVKVPGREALQRRDLRDGRDPGAPASRGPSDS